MIYSRMAQYSSSHLHKRDAIFKSQLHLGQYFNVDIINRLVHLFDNSQAIYGTPKIIKYIEDERKLRGLNNSFTVKSRVYISKKHKSTLILDIQNNNKSIVHLTIYLVLTTLNPEDSGMIHFGKNIYNGKNSRSKKIKSYAIISVEQSPGKPDSLHFSIGDGYNTPHVKNAHIYDPIIQQEMDVIIDVLNRIFDEDNKEFYIGIRHRDNTNYVNNHYKLYEPHKLTNNVLQNMNMYTTYNTRCNKGRIMHPLFHNNTTFIINENTYKKLPKKNGKRVTSRRTRL